MAQKTTAGEVIVSQRKEETIKEAKRIEEATLYSSKAHFNTSAFWRRLHFVLGLPATILAAIAAATAFSQFDQNNHIGGWISIVVAALSAVATFLNPNERAAAHFDAANQYDALHNKARIFWTIDCNSGDSDLVLSNRVKDFSEEKNELNRKSPQIPRWAYSRARKGIREGESSYIVDKPEA